MSQSAIISFSSEVFEIKSQNENPCFEIKLSGEKSENVLNPNTKNRKLFRPKIRPTVSQKNASHFFLEKCKLFFFYRKMQTIFFYRKMQVIFCFRKCKRFFISESAARKMQTIFISWRSLKNANDFFCKKRRAIKTLPFHPVSI